MTLLLLVLPAACGGNPMPAEPAVPVPEETAAAPEEAPCVHRPFQGDNVTEHEAAGYCGNTVTTISREERVWDEPWEASFWGEDSVALTDLLLYLDYSGDVCRCLPEYSVDTEFGTGYGVNLTEGYARSGGGQTDLTEEQVEQIREILERQGETPREGTAAKRRGANLPPGGLRLTPDAGPA